MKTTVIVCAVLSLAVAITGVNGQESTSLELADPSGFNERFAGNTKVSGQFLTGLALDGGEQPLNLSQVRLI